MFCNWISRVSDLRYESWRDATNQSWLMQRLNIVAGTRLYTGRRHRVMILSSSLLTRKAFFRFPNCSTQTSLYDYKMFKARNFGFEKKCNRTVRETKANALRGFFAFVFVNNEFSHNAARMHLFM